MVRDEHESDRRNAAKKSGLRLPRRVVMTYKRLHETRRDHIWGRVLQQNFRLLNRFFAAPEPVQEALG